MLARGLQDHARRFVDHLRSWLGTGAAWHEDLCEYYGVTPAEAHELGTRSPGRKPDLPASRSTHAVRGQTLEDLWEARRRDDPAAIQGFYEEVGAWFSFRQTYYHRNSRFPDVWSQVGEGMKLCEYGAGTAPITYGLVRAHPTLSASLTIADVPSEHLRFGEWRIRRLMERTGSRAKLEVLHVIADGLPLRGTYDVITILEVLEHVHNPLAVVKHLVEHLSADGVLWENFVAGEPGAENLPEAQMERGDVYSYLRGSMVQVSGKAAETPGGGGTRSWKKRSG